MSQKQHESCRARGAAVVESVERGAVALDLWEGREITDSPTPPVGTNKAVLLGCSNSSMQCNLSFLQLYLLTLRYAYRVSTDYRVGMVSK